MTPTSRSNLLASGATCIAEVDSLPDNPGDRAQVTAYTRLSLWWIDDTRPFIAVVEGLRGPAAPLDWKNKFRAVNAGTAARAIDWFDPSQLRDDLVDALPADLADVYPDANALRAQKAQEARGARGYTGEATVRGVAEWLYGKVSTAMLARAIERDFGVPWRTATNALNGDGGASWAKAFVVAMRHFDRSAWQARREREADDAGI